MSEKILKSRIVHKHDIEANWNLATNFSPLAGEIIVYDTDENNKNSRVKIGNGETNVNDLPFLTDQITENLPVKTIELEDTYFRPWEQIEESGLYKIVPNGSPMIRLRGINGDISNPTESNLIMLVNTNEILINVYKFVNGTRTQISFSVFSASGYNGNIYNYVLKDNVWTTSVGLTSLSIGNKNEYTPTSDYNPSTKKYVDDSVVAVSNLVGDTPVADQINSAIDAIPQSDWNQNDETAADYVLNKTHYEYVEYGDTLAWDGNTEGLESDASGTLFLVSDITPTIEDFQNGHAMKIDTEVEEWVVNSVIEDNGTLTNDTGLFFVVYEDNTTIEWTSFPKNGIYFSGSAQNPMARLAAPTVEYLRINGYNGFSTTTLKQLDEKFIPDSIARKEYVDTKFSTLVGDTPVSEQINNAIQPMTIEEIDAICAMDDIEALVIAEYLAEATDSEGNILTDNQDNTYVF